MVLNPHFRTLGLSGGGLWAYVLPRRVGARQARRLAWRALPVGAQEAVELGLADRVVPGSRPEFEGAVLEYADRLASSPRYERLLAAKREAREADERRKPLEAYRAEELAELSRDVFGDRRGFGEARRALVHGRRPACTPARLALHRRGSGASACT
ncbi:enoyl-CoA hydratase/isomerase family protein [Nonomuraea ferruginea]